MRSSRGRWEFQLAECAYKPRKSPRKTFSLVTLPSPLTKMPYTLPSLTSIAVSRDSHSSKIPPLPMPCENPVSGVYASRGHANASLS
jgi:hypothetical protein